MFSQQMKKQLDRKQLVFEQVYLLPHCHFHLIKCTYLMINKLFVTKLPKYYHYEHDLCASLVALK